MVFPPDAVSEDRLLTLYRWKSSACSPLLQENEAIVSDVVELSPGISERLTFNREVTLAISHSASDLKGYEVVVKTLIDKDSNEWVDVDKTVDFRSLSGNSFSIPFQSCLTTICYHNRISEISRTISYCTIVFR